MDKNEKIEQTESKRPEDLAKGFLAGLNGQQDPKEGEGKPRTITVTLEGKAVAILDHWYEEAIKGKGEIRTIKGIVAYLLEMGDAQLLEEKAQQTKRQESQQKESWQQPKVVPRQTGT